MRPDLTINAGLRYDYSSLFGDYKKAFGAAHRRGVGRQPARTRRSSRPTTACSTIAICSSAAATVPEKGRRLHQVGLRRRAAAARRRLHQLADRLRHHVGLSDRHRLRAARESRCTSSSRPTCATIRSRSTSCSASACTDPTKAPVVTSDNIQQLSGKTAGSGGRAPRRRSTRAPTSASSTCLAARSSATACCRSFRAARLEVTRTISQYSQDLVPYTNAFSGGVDQQIGRNMSVSAMFVHRRTRDLLTRRITNLFDVPPGNRRTSARRPTAVRS